MARAAKTVETTSRSGLTATYTAADATDGHYFANTNQNAIVHVKNASGGNVVVTIVTSQTIDGLAVTDRTVTVATSAEAFIGPFSNTAYGNTEGVYIDFDVATSITFTVFVAGANS